LLEIPWTQGYPCHLYFDLECAKPLNPGHEGSSAVDKLLHLVAEQLQEDFQIHIELNALRECTLELDSSTDGTLQFYANSKWCGILMMVL
jgi:hypothetical protein